MKAKKIVPENSEQPKTLPAPSNEERKDELAPWQKEIIALAEARLSMDGEYDVVYHMHQRAIGLCQIVENMAMGNSQCEVPRDALMHIMLVIEEHVQIAKWIAAGKPRYSRWD